MKKLLVIDFFNLMHRAFHAYPLDFKTSEGQHTNAVFGVTNLLLTYFKKQEPTHVVVAFEDDEVPTFRSTMYTAYKANRTWAEENKEEAEIFYNQVPLALDVLNAFNIPFVKCNGYEADDVAGAISVMCPKDTQVVILSNDQDLLQLVSSNVYVLRPARPPFVKETMFNVAQVEKKFGFGPTKIPDYKGLRGDPSDNIPGVKGIGEKTATTLLKQFDSIEDIYKNIEKVESKRTQTLLAQSAEEAVLSKKLATIDTKCPIEFNLQSYELHDFNRDNLEETFKKLEFNSLIKKLDDIFGKTPVKVETDEPTLF
jgi:DNA polymerase-1